MGVRLDDRLQAGVGVVDHTRLRARLLSYFTMQSTHSLSERLAPAVAPDHGLYARILVRSYWDRRSVRLLELPNYWVIGSLSNPKLTHSSRSSALWDIYISIEAGS